MRSRLGAVTFIVGSLIAAGAVVAIVTNDEPEAAISTATTSTSTTTTQRGPSTAPTTVVVGQSLPGPAGPTTAPPATAGPTSAGTAPPPPPEAAACGNGSADATPIPPEEPDGNRYPTRAEVASEFDRPIEINRLALRVTFANGTAQDVEMHTAGVVVPPGERRLLSGPTIESDSPPLRWQITLFVYQPEGRPDCAVST